MVSIRDRIRKIEKASRLSGPSYPYVVQKGEHETLEQAVERTFASFPARANRRVIVVPPQLSEAEWVKLHAP
jgi:hypothetical protein